MLSLAPPRVLVIEDDPDARANLRDILELDNYQVEVAESAAQALSRDNWPAYLAILLDRRLPDGTAAELLPQLRRLAPEAAVIVVTGYADVGGAIEAIRQGAADYLLKPIDPAELRTRLGRIVERRQAEERALQAERLAAIGQMVTGLAHEIRNVLQRGQANLEMLALEVPDHPRAMELIARQQRALDDLSHLYEEVRHYAAPIRLERAECDLASLWRQAWAEMEPSWRGRQVTLNECDDHSVLRCEDDHSVLRCEVDPYRMRQVFRNLFENALAACTDPVVIDILCEPCDLNGRPGLRLSVHDNGPGVEPHRRRQIFEPFYTTKTKGTGLGLAIVRRIIEAHGGRVDTLASSSGAEFVLTLPREVS
jgi:signal transduction histidine kinase